MSFLYPAFLIGAVAIAFPIVLHLLRRDVAPEVPFTAVRLLRRSPVERSKRRRLRDILLLAARIAALLLLAAAFARPYASGQGHAGTRVIAIDRSFSMGAPGQFARALELARNAVDEAGRAQRVAVIAFDDRADVVAAPGSRADARGALEALSPGSGATRYAPLIERAVEFSEAGGGTLVIVSDLQRAGWGDQAASELPPGWQIELRDVGKPPGNLAVTSIAVEPDRVLATVRNGWQESRRGILRVLHDGTEIGTSPYVVDGDASSAVAISLRVPSSGALAVALDDPEGFTADNVRYRVLGSGSQPTALIVASESSARQPAFYLARALETAAGEKGFAVDVLPGAVVSRSVVDSISKRSVVVLMSTRGLDRRAREALATYTRAGGGLWLAAAQDLEGSVVSTIFGWQPGLSPAAITRGGLTFAATDLRHPIFRPFGPLLANLGSVRFDRAWRVDPDGWSVLARFSDGNPALLERTEGSGRVVLFASDLDRRWNDFPLHPSFVPFAIETARHASGRVLSGGDLTVAEAPAGLNSPGVHTLAPGKRTVAINVDPREGETATLDRDEFSARFNASDSPAAPATRLHAQQLEARQSYWRYGLLLMLVALVAESVIGKARN
jgi:Aerotolerance regulator N-terminal/von Willebrand factor type A domain